MNIFKGYQKLFRILVVVILFSPTVSADERSLSNKYLTIRGTDIEEGQDLTRCAFLYEDL